MSFLINPYRFAPSGGGVTDPNFGDTWLLLGFEDGADGSEVITDESAAAHGVADLSVSGVHEIDTAQAKFGNSSLTLTSFGSIHFLGATEPNLTGEFGMEAFVRPRTTLSGQRGFVATGAAGATRGVWFYTDGTNIRFYGWNPAGSLVVALSTAWNPSIDTWYHVAVTRDSLNAIRIFIDGSIVATGSYSGAFRNGSNSINVGTYYPNQSATWNGWMDEVRCYNGFCPYDAAFTPPTAPHPRS